MQLNNNKSKGVGLPELSLQSFVSSIPQYFQEEVRI